MRRALMVTGDYPPSPGGQARFLHDLWGGLPADRVTVLAPVFGGDAGRANEEGPRVVRVRLPLGRSTPARLARTLVLAWHALLEARRRRVAAVHAGQLMAGGTAALLCHRVLGCPYSLVVHGADLLEFAHHPLAGRLAAAILRNAGRVVANSRFTAGEVTRLGAVRARVRVVHPVVDAAKFAAERGAAALRARFALSGDRVLLTVGRLVRRKGHDTVLDALPAVLREVPDTRYLVVGDGPERQRLEERARELGLQDRVIFVGFVPDEDLPAYYAAADLFVMVSRERPDHGDLEGFGIVYLEASAAGRAVVAGRSGGVADAVEHGVSGLLVDPEDTKQLERVLCRLLLDGELRNRLARAGQRRAFDEFGTDSGSAAFVEVMDELAGSH